MPLRTADLSCVRPHVVRLWETSKPVDARELGLDADVKQSDRWELAYRNRSIISLLRRRKASVGKFSRNSLSWYSRFSKPSIVSLVTRRWVRSILLICLFRCGEQNTECDTEYAYSRWDRTYAIKSRLNRSVSRNAKLLRINPTLDNLALDIFIAVWLSIS